MSAMIKRTSLLFQIIKALCYKTFYFRKMLMFIITVFVPGKHFQPCLIYVSKAGAYFGIKHLSDAPTLGLAPGAIFTTLYFLRNLRVGPIS